MRVGIVGGGQMADTYWDAVHGTGHRVLGLATTAPFGTAVVDKASAASVPVVRDIEALIQSAQPGDAIIVTSRHAAHTRATVAAMRAGLHVLCEKPVATALDEVEQILVGVESLAPGQVLVACPIRETRVMAEVARVWRENAHGPVLAATSRLDVPGPPRSNWYYSTEAIGGASLDTLVYALARALVLLGVPTHVSGTHVARTIESRRNLDGGMVAPAVDDNTMILLGYGNGRLLTAKSAWFHRRPIDRIELEGRHNQLVCDYMTGTVTLFSGSHLLGTEDRKQIMARIAYPHTGIAKWLHFLDRARRGVSEYDAALLANEIILRCLDGRRVEVPDGSTLRKSQNLMAERPSINDD